MKASKVELRFSSYSFWSLPLPKSTYCRQLAVGMNFPMPASSIVQVSIYIALCVFASYINGNMLYATFCYKHKYDYIHWYFL